MTATIRRPALRCAIYTRKSSEEGLEQSFNSLHAQREACEAYIKSQAPEGWRLVREAFDDGGYSGGTLERPALRRLLDKVRARRVDVIVVYKIDRLTRSLADFARLAETFEQHGVSFVSVTQQFNTTTSMGRLMLNVLLSFAQFEREVTGERIRDKIAASKRKGMWMGGYVPLGYDAKDRMLVINEAEAETVRSLYRLYQKHGNVRAAAIEAEELGLRSKVRLGPDGHPKGGRSFSRGHIYRILANPLLPAGSRTATRPILVCTRRSSTPRLGRQCSDSWPATGPASGPVSQWARRACSSACWSICKGTATPHPTPSRPAGDTATTSSGR